MCDDIHDECLHELTDKLIPLVFEAAQKRNDRNMHIVITLLGFVWI